jgi:hypothetical protein
VISSLFFSLFARRSSTKYMRKIILVYTSTSAPLGIPNTFPKKSNTEGKKVKIRSPAPTERKTRKWRALNFCRRDISNASRNMIIPDMMKKAWRRFMA